MDKGYDANYIHQFFRELEAYSIIPARKGCRRGNYRKEMRDFFDYAQYWERNCAEWNNSSLKRVFGDYVRSRNFRTQHSEVAARIILHNLKVVFLRLFHVSPFKDEVRKLYREKLIRYIGNKTPSLLKKYFLPVFAGFIIASPLPDEIGVTLLAASKSISAKVFSVISYALNTAGIFAILLAGRLI